MLGADGEGVTVIEKDVAATVCGTAQDSLDVIVQLMEWFPTDSEDVVYVGLLLPTGVPPSLHA